MSASREQLLTADSKIQIVAQEDKQPVTQSLNDKLKALSSFKETLEQKLSPLRSPIFLNKFFLGLAVAITLIAEITFLMLAYLLFKPRLSQAQDLCPAIGNYDSLCANQTIFQNNTECIDAQALWCDSADAFKKYGTIAPILTFVFGTTFICWAFIRLCYLFSNPDPNAMVTSSVVPLLPPDEELNRLNSEALELGLAVSKESEDPVTPWLEVAEKAKQETQTLSAKSKLSSNIRQTFFDVTERYELQPYFSSGKNQAGEIVLQYLDAEDPDKKVIAKPCK